MNLRRRRSAYREEYGSREHRVLLLESFPDCKEVLDGGGAFLEGGVDNLNLRLDDSSGRPRFVARHYLISSAAKVEAELNLVSMLEGQGFPTPRPVRTADDTLFLDRGEEPVIAVFPFISGEVTAGWDLERKRRGAAAIARMHCICRDQGYRIGRGKPRLETLRAGPPTVAADKVPGHEILTAAVSDFLAELEPQREAFEALLVGPVHHDLNEGNVVWNGEEMGALIDFDECHDAPLIMDLAAAFHYLGLQNFELDAPSIAAVLEGYEGIRRLSGEEWHFLPLAWDLLNLTSAVEFVVENRDWLGDARECHSLTKIYLPLKGQIESILETLGGSERADKGDESGSERIGHLD